MQKELNINDEHIHVSPAAEKRGSDITQFLPGLSDVSGPYYRLEQQLTKPARCLPIQVIWELAQKLHECRARVGNWINLAEHLGYGRDGIEQFVVEGGTHKETPGYMMLLDWTKQERGRSLFVLIETLRSLDRQDCVQFLLQKIEEMMFMFLFIHIVDETSPHSISQHLKIRTLNDCSIKDSLENLLAGNSDDYEYEVVDVSLHEKAGKFRGEEITVRRKHKTEMKSSETVVSVADSMDSIKSDEKPKTSTRGKFLSSPKRGKMSEEPASVLKMEESRPSSFTTFSADTSESINQLQQIYENFIDPTSNTCTNIKSIDFDDQVPVQSLGKEEQSLPYLSSAEVEMREAFQTNSLFVEVSMTPGTQYLKSPSSMVVGDTLFQRANIADSYLYDQREDLHRFILDDDSVNLPSQRFSNDKGELPSNFNIGSQSNSLSNECKLQYITEECVYCGKTKTTKLVTGKEKLAISAGVHCPSCRCAPPSGVPNFMFHHVANDNSRTGDKSRDLVRPISEDVISSTTRDDTDSVRSGITQQTGHGSQNLNETMKMETTIVQYSGEMTVNVEDAQVYRGSQIVGSHDSEAEMYLTTENPGPNFCPYEDDGNPLVSFHDHTGKLMASRPRCNTHPLVRDPVSSPDFCIAQTDDAFRHIRNQPSQTYSKSEEQVLGSRQESGNSLSLKPVQLTKTHVCNTLRNFPGWNPDIDEKNVERVMKDIRGEDGHYVIWFMGSKNRIVLSVSHLRKLIHYAIYAELNRQGAVIYRIFEEQFGDVRTLLRYYQKNGLSPQSQQGQSQDISFTEQQNLRDSRRIARLSHVHMKFPFRFRTGRNSADARKSV